MNLRGAFGVAVLSMAGTCLAQSSPALYPRHIESPVYPQIAHTAHITGTVVLRVTVAADGSVAVVVVESKPNKILDRSATENVRHWTFAKPPTAPYVETITYVYEIDPSLREGDQRVSFDLPDRVDLRTYAETIEP